MGFANTSFAAFVDDAVAELNAMSEKQRHTRQLLLQNGRLLDSNRMSGVEYAFSIEPEVYLPDGVDVTWCGDGRRVQGSVVFRSGDIVEIWFESQIGRNISNIEVFVGVPDFLDILATRLKTHRLSTSIMANELIKASRQRTHNVIEWSPTGTDYATEILDMGLCFVWGPPGTGKTYTLSEVAYRLIMDGKRVLMISNTNVAVDQAVIELSNKLGDGRRVLARFGVPKDMRIVGNARLSSYEMALSDAPGLRKRRDALLEEKKSAKPAQRARITASFWISAIRYAN